MSSIHVLVVEDDQDINHLLCRIAEESGYRVQAAFSGTEALLYVERQAWDVILLDLMLPGRSGEELLEDIRGRSNAAVIVISAKGERQTKIGMLRGGADDYITKPFDNEEVAARIEAQVRRMARSGQTEMSRLAFKDIAIDSDTKQVTVAGQLVVLTAREYKILELFLTYPKKLFTKENIIERIWGQDFYGDDNTVNVHLSHLRTKLSKANPEQEYIETIWGMGYRLKK